MPERSGFGDIGRARGLRRQRRVIADLPMLDYRKDVLL
jgi:hypothetical protein